MFQYSSTCIVRLSTTNIPNRLHVRTYALIDFIPCDYSHGARNVSYRHLVVVLLDLQLLVLHELRATSLQVQPPSRPEYTKEKLYLKSLL